VLVESTMVDPIKLLLLDRDGVINVDSKHYIKKAEEWHPIAGSINAIVQLQHCVKIAVCTNQAGIGRGLFAETALTAIHTKMNNAIVQAGGEAIDIYYCPHAPAQDCYCRKPKSGLLTLAMQGHQCLAKNTLYVGDSEKDLLAALNAKCRSVLVLTGNGSKTAKTPAAQYAGAIVENLAALADRTIVTGILDI